MDAYTSLPAGLGVCSNGFDDTIINGFCGDSTCSTQYDGELDMVRVW
ncbi:hypothetical protein BOA8489_00693 [Boseongicola aestuarii]|uniref:Uncharacterized protein n=1 Tax=Boseongicola aestuarii TaxID=1470561 RepID=A0A238IXL1_9RHOB|nr:hypothetical protein BOA8489_00693 [Boseongicola aestuarii]